MTGGRGECSRQAEWKVLSARSPDGSCVRRESHAQFYERPEVQFLRPTHHSLHWVMDMIFRDDECRVRTDHAPANFTTVKHMAHNLIREAPAKTLCASGARSPLGMTTSLQASSSHESFTRVPWQERGRPM